MKSLYSIELTEKVGDEYFKEQGRVKISFADGVPRWYLPDSSEYAIVSQKDLEILHFRRTPAGWLAFDPYISTIGQLHGSF